MLTRSGDAAKLKMKGKTGIVFFKDIPGYQGGTGDHIDVWDGENAKTGAYFGAMEIWFWEMK